MKLFKKIIIWFFIVVWLNIAQADYKVLVTNILDAIEQSNANKTNLQKRANFQWYIPKIQSLTVIDQRVKDIFIQFLNAKIAEIDKENKTTIYKSNINNINRDRVQQSRLSRHNTERQTKNLSKLEISPELNNTAQNRANHLAKIDKSSHERNPGDWYYNYAKIKTRFEWFGLIFPAEKNWIANFHENIADWLNYKCDKTDCTDYLIGRIKDWFDFFMSEKSDNWAHYAWLMKSVNKKIWLGIAISNSKKIYIVTHYSVNF